MLSMLATIQPGDVWKPWIDHITEHRNDYGLQKACLVEHNGRISSASKGFHPTAKEIQVGPGVIVTSDCLYSNSALEIMLQ